MASQKINLKLSLVVPFYNEEKEIGTTYKKLKDSLNKNFKKYELIFVNDGSIDSSEKILKSFIKGDKKTKLISYNKNKGRGYAVTKGFNISKGDLVGYIDSDLEIKVPYIYKCLVKLPEYDGVVVSKHMPGSIVKTTYKRKIASRIFNLWVRLVLNSKIKDHQAGLKIFKKDLVKNILPKVHAQGWLFDIELLYFAQKKGYKIAEIPIEITYGFGRISQSFITDFIKSFYHVLKLKNQK